MPRQKNPQNPERRPFRLFDEKDLFAEAFAIFVVAVIAAGYLIPNSIHHIVLAGSGLSNAPSEHRYDDVDYDNIAISLLRHGTFAFDWDSEEWRSRFRPFNGDGRFDPVFNDRHGYGLTGFKPPLVPFLMSLEYRAFGTGFAGARIMHLSFMTAAVLAAILFAGWFGGYWMAAVTAFAVLLRPHPVIFGTMLMPESVTTFFVTASSLLLFFLLRKSRLDPASTHWALAALSGVSVGLTLLSRSMFIVYFACLLLAAALHCYTLRRDPRARPVLIQWSLFFAAALVIVTPWWIRNCIVTRHFAPLGTQGTMVIAGSYSDESYADHGEWNFESFTAAYHTFENEHKDLQVPSAEHEYLRGQYGKSVAYAWAREHWDKLPWLLTMRVYSSFFHFRIFPGDIPLLRFLLGFLLLAGLVGWMRHPDYPVFLGVFVMSVVTAAATYASGSIFLTPLVPVFGVTTAGILFFFRKNERAEQWADAYRTLCTIIAVCIAWIRRWFRVIATVLIAVVTVTVIANVTVTAALKRFQTLSFPPECTCDDADYENIGFRLFKEHVYGFDWRDPDWRRRYEAFNSKSYFTEYLKRDARHITTYEPPLLPITISVIYRIFGTGFAVPRIMNLTLMSLGFAAAIVFSGLELGVFGALITALLIYYRQPYDNLAVSFFTEGMATFFFGAFFTSFFFLARRSAQDPQTVQTGFAVLAGLSFGFLILTRSIYALWLPFILLAGVIQYFLRNPVHRGVFLKTWVFLILSSCIVASPWWIRNSIVSGHFFPLGSQGGTSLPGGYSDDSYNNDGNWDYYAFRRPYDEFENTYTDPPNAAPAEKEYWRARHSQQAALTWIRENPEKLPRLFFKRVSLHHIVLGSWMTTFMVFVLVAAGAACWFFVPGGWIFLFILLTDALVIGVTYEAGGRYAVPLVPAFSVAAAGVLLLPGLLKKK